MTVKDFYTTASDEVKQAFGFIVSYEDEYGDFYNVHDPLDERVANRKVTEWWLGSYNVIIHCW